MMSSIKVQGAGCKQDLSYAYSNDGISSWTQASGSIYDTSSFTWADAEVRSPSMYLDGSILHMWFAGHSLTPAPFTLGLGYATCDLTP